MEQLLPPLAFQKVSFIDNVKTGHISPTPGDPSTNSKVTSQLLSHRGTATTSGFNLFRINDFFEKEAT